MAKLNNISTKENYPVLLFDGVCNMCNAFVQFVIKRDKSGLIHFASLQSEYGKAFINKHDIPFKNMDSVILIDEEQKILVKSDVSFELFKRFGGVWTILSIFKYLPRFIRDFCYDLIAKNRYRMFGKKDSCMIPTPDVAKRFLG